MKTCFWALPFILLLPAGAAAAETLTLREYFGQVTENNLTLRQADEHIAALRQAMAEQESYFYPTVTVSGGYAYARRDGAPLSGLRPAEGDANALSIGLSQPLYSGGALQAGYRASEYALRSARSEYDLVRQTLAYLANRAFIAVLRAQKLASVARELVDNRQRHLEVVATRVRVGVLPRLEQLRAEVELANSRNGLLAAENVLKAAYSGLNRLRERSLEEEPQLVEIAGDLPPDAAELSVWLVDAMRLRPELESASLAIRQAEEGGKLARSGFFPRVYLNVSREYAQDEAFRSNWRDADSLGVFFSWDIWNRGRVRAMVEESRHRLEQAALRRDEVALNIGLEVKNAWLALVSARDRTAAVEKAVEQAEEVLRMQRIRFDEGMATPTEVMDAEFALAQARTNYYEAVYDFLAAKAELNRSAGITPES